MSDAPISHSGLHVLLQQKTPISLDVSLDCAPGEILGLVGPSGSGKSTVLRSIAGLHNPTVGFVATGGETWLDTAKSEVRPVASRRVGMVFQNYALFPHLSAWENIAIAMSDLTAADRKVRALSLLAKVNLTGLESRRPAQLSGGQQQRVAIARALARDPKVLLLDEPFSAVDKLTREKLYRELVALRSELNMPVILVTHDLAEAAMLCDRLCLLHRGNTLQIAPPEDIMTRPVSVDAARLVGITNTFQGVIASHDAAEGKTWIDWTPYRLEAPLQPTLQPGDKVDWVMPSAFIVLHRKDRPSRGEHENPVSGTVAEMVRLGEYSQVDLAITGGAERRLRFTIPTHVANRNGLAPGASASVSLLSEGIHVIGRAG